MKPDFTKTKAARIETENPAGQNEIPDDEKADHSLMTETGIWTKRRLQQQQLPQPKPQLRVHLQLQTNLHNLHTNLRIRTPAENNPDHLLDAIKHQASQITTISVIDHLQITQETTLEAVKGRDQDPTTDMTGIDHPDQECSPDQILQAEQTTLQAQDQRL
jgi:hypothetical protein